MNHIGAASEELSPPRIEILGGGDMQALYFRNNRNDGLKNLQCFPHCTNRHKEKQFCGSSLNCTVHLSGELAATPPEQLLVVGEFRTQQAFAADLQTSRSHTLSLKQFLWERKTVSTMFGRFYEGTRVRLQDQPSAAGGGASSFRYQFNAELAGWNYGWQSNKHKTKDWHVFQVSVYVLDLTTGGIEDEEDGQDGQDEDTDSPVRFSPSTDREDHCTQDSHEHFSLLMRTATPPFRILSARRKKDLSPSVAGSSASTPLTPQMTPPPASWLRAHISPSAAACSMLSPLHGRTRDHPQHRHQHPQGPCEHTQGPYQRLHEDAMGRAYLDMMAETLHAPEQLEGTGGLCCPQHSCAAAAQGGKRLRRGLHEVAPCCCGRTGLQLYGHSSRLPPSAPAAQTPSRLPLPTLDPLRPELTSLDFSPVSAAASSGMTAGSISERGGDGGGLSSGGPESDVVAAARRRLMRYLESLHINPLSGSRRGIDSAGSGPVALSFAPPSDVTD